jgi:integrase/recombinase XerD
MSDLVPVSSLADEVAEYGPTRRVQVLVAAWLASFNSVNTQKAYARDMKMWLKFCGDHDLDPLAVVRAAIDGWKQIGAGYPPGAKDTSKARRLSAISSWYDYLVHEEVIERSPAAHIKRPKVDSNYSPTRGLSREEALEMLQTAYESSPRDLVVVSLLMLSGLRCAEAILADVDDLGSERGHETLDVIRKGGIKQRVVLAPETRESIEEYLGGRDCGPLLITEGGGRLSASQVFRTVRKIASWAKVPHADKISPHSLRHTYATLALDSGAQLRDVQTAMGHRDPKTTIRYDRARGQLDRSPTYKLTEYLTGDQKGNAS